MANKHTIHRREARKKARARRLEWLARDPATRMYQEQFNNLFKEIYAEAIAEEVKRASLWSEFVKSYR